MRIELEDPKKAAKDKENETEAKELEESKSSDKYEDDSLEYSALSLSKKIAYKKNAFKERTKNMTFAGKFKYVFTMYRFELILSVIIAAVVILAGSLIYRASLPSLLHIVVLNQTFEGEELEQYIAKEYREYLGANDKNFITVYKNMSVSANEDPEVVNLTMTDYQTLGHYNLKDMLDIIICDEEALKTYAWSEDTGYIDYSMDAALFEKLKDKAVLVKDESGVKNNGKEYYGALDISDTQFVKEAGIEYRPVYLLIPSTKYKDNEETINFIKMVYGL